jgi:signal transduction histidine kinase
MTVVVSGTAASDTRLRSLVEAGITIGSEFSIDAMLQSIVEAAARLTGARYAALGVLDAAGHELERFVTTGMDARTRATIGALPRGRGVLGVLIHEKRSLRLDDLGQDPRSVGFPPGHPVMRSFLGVPILIGSTSYGNLYLTDKESGDPFTAEDQELIELLARQAASAISNQRVLDAARRWAHQLESVAEIGDALLAQASSAELHELVVREFRGLLDAEFATLELRGPDGSLVCAAAEWENGDAETWNSPIRLDNRFMRLLLRGSSVRSDSLLDEPDTPLGAVRALGLRTLIAVPVIAGTDVIGFLAAANKHGEDPRFPDDDLRVAEVFASRIGTLLELAERVSRESVEAVVEAQEADRRRIALELHDQTGQELTSALLALKAIEAVASGNEEVSAAVADLRELLVTTLQNVRRLATELRPSALTDYGLEAALRHLAGTLEQRSGVSIGLLSELGDRRLDPMIETTLYRTVQEALTNVVRHADATEATVTISARDGSILAEVTDNGRGFDVGTARGLGLAGARERTGLVGGRLDVHSRPGRGTTITIEVPLL